MKSSSVSKSKGNRKFRQTGNLASLLSLFEVYDTSYVTGMFTQFDFSNNIYNTTGYIETFRPILL